MRKFSDGSDATLGTLAKWAPLFGPKVPCPYSILRLRSHVATAPETRADAP